MVTRETMVNALRELGVCEGDSVLVHSSFKSLGEVENGADTVVSGLLEAVGSSGTVIFPTLCQKDWENVYTNWHLDADSDVGYLTNYFRKLPQAVRSNQATHSVAAIGKDAAYITATHGETGLRHGIYGSTPFSADSPWEKMYEMDTKVIFIGCRLRACTFRHLAEYQFMHKYQELAKKKPHAQELIDRIWCYERWNDRGVWWHIDNLYLEELLKKENKIHTTRCGDAEIKMVSSKEFVNLAHSVMEARDLNAFYVDNGGWNPQDTIDWLNEVDN